MKLQEKKFVDSDFSEANLGQNFDPFPLKISQISPQI